MFTAKMEEPWGCKQNVSEEVLNCSFEDNFKPIVRLPDSQQHLEILEKKLDRIKSGSNKKNLLKSLEEVKNTYLEQLVSSDSDKILRDIILDEPVNSTAILLAPEKQAQTIGELVELLKHDELSKIFENDQPST